MATHGFTRCICGHYFKDHDGVGDHAGFCQKCSCVDFVDKRTPGVATATEISAAQAVAWLAKSEVHPPVVHPPIDVQLALREELAKEVSISHTCHARGCKATCDPTKLMCFAHWRIVPPALKRAVIAAYRPGQCDDMDPSEAWFRAADAAIAAVAELEGCAW